MKNKRIEYLDLVKFIAILLVCIGHWYAKVPALDSSLNPIIYSFHMPLFMLVCGYFSVKALELPVRELLIKKGKQLLIPTIACTIVAIGLYGGAIGIEIIGCVWFLKALFACYIIARISKLTHLPIEIAFLTSWVILLYIPYGGTLQINFLYFYFCVGYLLHKWQDKIQSLKLPLFVFSLLFFVFSIGKHWAVPYQKIDMSFLLHSSLLFLVQVLIGLSGALVVVGICALIDKLRGQKGCKVFRGLSVIGKYTLGIYVVQTFVLERSLPQFSFLNNSLLNSSLTDYIVIPLIGFVLCIICYFIVRLTARINLINTLFYGGIRY